MTRYQAPKHLHVMQCNFLASQMEGQLLNSNIKHYTNSPKLSLVQMKAIIILQIVNSHKEEEDILDNIDLPVPGLLNLTFVRKEADPVVSCLLWRAQG